MSTLTLRSWFTGGNLSALAGPALIIMVLAMMVLPLPPLLLDILFSFNIALAMIVLLVSMYTLKPLDFAVFPTVLLLTTLLRLSLNVASTRVVLLNGHTGPDAAGKVIEAFAQFLVGGNFAVGFVVFIILVVINFVVITKGAGRIAEVAARFTLDAMPGKQMAIDADLSAGLIGEDEARRRRTEIAHEADFYGSMDGASKFVRGDAIAGILILFITIIGGLAVGMLQHDMSFATAGKNYVLLAIGDGLVAQIPALIISVAAGLIVSRVGKDHDTSKQLMMQLFNTPRVLLITASVLAVLGLIPGMPHFSFLLLAIVLSSVVWWQLRREQQRQIKAAEPEPVPTASTEAPEVSWDELQPVDVLGLEVGYRLIPLVDKGQDGELLRRIKAIRKKFAQEVGFLPPAVHIRDNLELGPNTYRFLLKGVPIAEGEANTNLLLAINPGGVTGNLVGTNTQDPAFGLPAVWIENATRDRAQSMGYTVVDAGTVLATHLSTLIQSHAAQLLGRQETQALLDQFMKYSPKLLDELVPKVLPLSAVQRVLQNLLDESVAIRDLRTIMETLAEHAPRSQDPIELTAAVRVALARAITQQCFGSVNELQVIAFAPELEQVLQQVTGALSAEGIGLEPGLADTLQREMSNAVRRQEALGLPTVLLTPDRLRLALSKLLRRGLPQLRVLSHSEIPDSKTIRVSTVVGGKS